MTPKPAAIEYEVLLDDLEQLVHVHAMKYNATPHDGLCGRSPLQVLEWSIETMVCSFAQCPEIGSVWAC